MKRIIENDIEFFKFDNLEKENSVISHYITTRQYPLTEGAYDGFNMCDYTGDDPEKVDICRDKFCDVAGIKPENLWFPRQVHGSDILIIDEPELQREEVKNMTFDVVMTDKPGQCIGVSTADCVPILLFDPRKKVIAAVHAGWRGTVARIASKSISAMRDMFDSNPEDIIAGLGPAISIKSFEVGDEVVDAFRKSGFAEELYSKNEETGKYHIDLWKANADDLVNAGLNPGNIEISGVCTIENSDKLFSARKLGVKSGRTATCIMLK